MGRYLFVIPATNRTRFSRDSRFMYLFCLGESGYLAEA